MEDKEEKASFFGAYYGVRVARSPLWNDKLPNGKAYPELASNPKNEFYLELKLLSALSNEDAKTIAEFMGFAWEGDIAKSFIWGLFLVDSNDYMKYELVIKQMLFKFSDISSTVDLIRRLGYAYEFMGKSIEEQINKKWIKIK